MNAWAWMRRRAPEWQRLQDLLNRFEQGARRLSLPECRELGRRYRSLARDRIQAAAFPSGLVLVDFLNRLTTRAYLVLAHRSSHRRGSFVSFWWQDVPRAARASMPEIIFTLIVFWFSFLLGLALTTHDERTGLLVLPRPIWHSIQRGELWTDSLTAIVPGGKLTAQLWANNVSVALLAFAGGLLAGLPTLYVLVLNGWILGAAVSLCHRHGLLPGLIDFALSHGCAELSAIVGASAAGFVVARSLWRPEGGRFAGGLAEASTRGWRLAASALPTLSVCAVVESYVSTWHVLATGPRLLLGTLLFLAYWGWLLIPSASQSNQMVSKSSARSLRSKNEPSSGSLQN